MSKKEKGFCQICADYAEGKAWSQLKPGGFKPHPEISDKVKEATSAVHPGKIIVCKEHTALARQQAEHIAYCSGSKVEKVEVVVIPTNH